MVGKLVNDGSLQIEISSVGFISVGKKRVIQTQLEPSWLKLMQCGSNTASQMERMVVADHHRHLNLHRRKAVTHVRRQQL